MNYDHASSKWKEGIDSILQALNFDENNDKDDERTDKDIDNNLITTIANTASSSLSSLLVQKTLRLFKGEKSFFVGREEYINKIIKEQIKIPSIKIFYCGTRWFRKESACIQGYPSV